jgi:hypothetical protein
MSSVRSTKTFWSGSHYEGGMRKGKRHGRGTKVWPNGDKYEGEWAEDLKEGRGVMTIADSCYDGEWLAGMRHGKGKLTWEGGEFYEGEWREDCSHGKGRFHKKNGNVYEGEYVRDKCHGFGTYSFSNGDKYAGHWKGGLKDGHGEITWANGRKFVGRFAGDCPIIGELTEADGNVYRVTYDGNIKFSRGAQPETQELIGKAEGLVHGDVYAAQDNSVLAPALKAHAAALRGNEEASQEQTTTTAQPSGAQQGDPFAEMALASSSVLAAELALKSADANEWDPFGGQPDANSAKGALSSTQVCARGFDMGSLAPTHTLATSEVHESVCACVGGGEGEARKWPCKRPCLRELAATQPNALRGVEP